MSKVAQINPVPQTLRGSIMAWFDKNPTASSRTAPLAKIIGAAESSVAEACTKLWLQGKLVRCRIIVPKDQRTPGARIEQFDYRKALGTATPEFKQYKTVPTYRREAKQHKSTPAGGGENNTGSAPSETRVAGSVMTADLSPRGAPLSSSQRRMKRRRRLAPTPYPSQPTTRPAWHSRKKKTATSSPPIFRRSITTRPPWLPPCAQPATPGARPPFLNPPQP